MKTTRKLQDFLKDYSDRGFCLFPMNGKTKRPFFKDMLEKASSDYDQLIQWAQEYPGCGWALSCAKSGFVAVDVDHKHGGMEKWQALIEEHGEPNTLKQHTSTNGFHYLFSQGDKENRFKGKLTPGIDIKHNGYIIVFPTRGSNGNEYQWQEVFQKAEINPVPEWLFALIAKKTKEGTVKTGLKFSEDYLEKLALAFQECELDYEEWYKVGMGFHSIDSTPKGLDLWKKASQGESFQEGDLETCEAKWDSFTQDEDGIGQMSLTFILRQKGVDVPNPFLEDDKKIFADAIEETNKRQQSESEHKFIEEAGRWITWSKSVILQKMRDEGYFFYTEGGNASIVCLKRGERGGLKANTMTTKTLKEKLAPYFLKHKAKTPAGNVVIKYKSAADVFLESTQRPEVDRIVFKPEAGPRELSTWSEPPLSPAPVTSLLDDFLKIVVFQSICNNNHTHYKEVMGMLAHIIQKPTERSSKILTIFGDQGTGKGLLFVEIMGRILGDLSLTISNPRMLTDRFNTPLANRLLLVGDEIVAGDSRSFNSAIKNFSGNSVLQIEEKYGASYPIDNYARMVLLSNSDNSVMVERSNRRIYMIHTNDEFAGRVDVFDRFWEGVRSGNLAKQFLKFLQEYSLEGWHAHILPKDNRDGKAAKLDTAGIEAEYWNHRFSEKPTSLFRCKEGEEKEWLDRNEVFDDFQQFIDNMKFRGPMVTPERFWRESKKIMKSLNGVGIKRQKKEWGGGYFMYTSPEELKSEFYESLQIPEPDGFEPWDYYINDDEQEFQE